MNMEDETVEIGGVKVPKAFADRWKELLTVNKQLKGQLQESQASLVLAQEEAATGSTKELEKATLRIKELETELEGSAWTSALSEDGLHEDADTLDYLQYQYGKVTPAEGEAKPSVKDWYGTFKEKSTVVQAAKKVAATARKTASAGDTAPDKAEGAPAKGGTAPANGTKVQASTRPVPPKTTPIPSDAGGLDANGLAGLDPRDFAANRQTLRKQLFGS